jgi:hypothetical protein
VTNPEDAKTRTRRAVAELLAGSGLHLQELANELVITNPDDPEKGQVHVDFTDGYVSWEHVTWTYWGTLQGLRDTGEGLVSGQTILDTLLSSLGASYGRTPLAEEV